VAVILSLSVLSLSPLMATLSAAAALLLSSLETASRSDGSSFIRLSSSAPSWGSGVLMAAHGSELPNDSRYELISSCLEALSQGSFNDEEEAAEALCDLSLDLLPCWTEELLSWFSARCSRLSSCDEAMESGRISEFSTFELLSEGWRVDCEEMLSSLISSLEEERGSLFNPDTDCQLLLSDSHGVYIPQLYCSDISEDDCEDLSVSWEDVRACQSGRGSELYWEAWQSICDSASWEENGSEWRLLQNGDLWAVKADVEIPEEWLS
jgi:hypothetical protein